MNEVIDKHYKENYEILLKRVNRRLGCLEDAEDVVQEAFSRAIEYYNSYNPKKCKYFNNWFDVILNNVYKKFITEKKSGGMTKSLDDSLDEIQPVLPDHYKSISKKELKRLINSRSGDSKEVISLNINFGYNPSEIKLLTGYKLTFIYNTIKSFSKEIKELYSDERGSAGPGM